MRAWFRGILNPLEYCPPVFTLCCLKTKDLFIVACCDYEQSGHLLSLLFLQAYICVNSCITVSVCEISGIMP